ncbi:MAG: FAD-dependent oxidoreductase [Chloroflexi bacterium]|nr:FAD-dependent oxidoreductase [Chloroflexota bacterium]
MKEETYDVVIVGAGHNGTTLAAYLAKCGLSVCLLESRPEGGGAQENTEIFAGVRASVHAVGHVSGAAPAWEQLELGKYGFRGQWPTTTKTQGQPPPYVLTTEGWAKTSEAQWDAGPTALHQGTPEGRILVPTTSSRGGSDCREHTLYAGV